MNAHSNTTAPVTPASDVAPIEEGSPYDQDRRARHYLTAYVETHDHASLDRALAHKGYSASTAILRAKAIHEMIANDREADQHDVVRLAVSLADEMVAMEGASFLHVGLPAVPKGRDREVAFAYMQWLHMEKRLLAAQLWPDIWEGENMIPAGTAAQSFHLPLDRPWTDVPMPSTRAERVLETVGVDLSECGR